VARLRWDRGGGQRGGESQKGGGGSGVRGTSWRPKGKRRRRGMRICRSQSVSGGGDHCRIREQKDIADAGVYPHGQCKVGACRMGGSLWVHQKEH